MRFCGHRLRHSACLLFGLVNVLTLSSAQATGAKRQRTDCTWGASSIRAEVVDGKLVAAPPATSGCIPTSKEQARSLSSRASGEQGLNQQLSPRTAQTPFQASTRTDEVRGPAAAPPTPAD
jgi:hypothetical protein